MKNWVYVVGVACLAAGVFFCCAICFQDVGDQRHAVKGDLVALWALFLVGSVCLLPSLAGLVGRRRREPRYWFFAARGTTSTSPIADTPRLAPLPVGLPEHLPERKKARRRSKAGKLARRAAV
jgi:hypothetical protein